jgi:triphosphoribosyl-dephospho-CoA synthase
VSLGTLSARDVSVLAQMACLLEVSAPKPGNVGPGRHFADARFEDFLASAAAIGAPLGEAGSRPLGETIRRAIEATSRWTRSNTNLGIVLLLAPLARAALVGDLSSLRDSVAAVLDETTVGDAREVYAAIRLASPGGLGRVDSEDLAGEPRVTLLETMRLARDRDGVAREYATAFETTFGVGTSALRGARDAGLAWEDAVVETFLTLLAGSPDTHIARRAGVAFAAEVSRRAREVLEEGGPRSEAGWRAVEGLDRELRDTRNRGNPGTTADLTAAAVFVHLLGRGFP